jgi:Tol biopolymer transport system component
MTLAAGSKLGPYEILSLLGAGGMGEVYRARDPRLGRDVAIKVLPSSFSDNSDRLRRFAQEAKAAGILNHPNITAVFDIGDHEGSPYVVQELLEGETLRSVLAGRKLPQRKAVDYALQMAHGLAAAHDKGIVHRDLKPDNIFVTKDGRIKILDFGLAKLTQIGDTDTGPQTNLPTASGTEPGVVMGTLRYMSPEQVKGKPADARSDIFALGAILYEMVAGKHAFGGDSAGETMASILKEEPPDLTLANQSIPPGLERTIRHCLEKNPEQRFHSAHDLAFDIESLSGLSAPTGAVPAAPLAASRRRRSLAAAALALLVAVGVGSFLAGRRVGSSRASADVTFKALTYRSWPVFRALFAPDGRTVVFSAARAGNRPEIFTLDPGYPEPKPLGLPEAHLLSVSRQGELALLTKTRFIYSRIFSGTLARMPLGGGAPREVLEGVQEADWAPDGENLAIIHEVDGQEHLEYPIGKVLYATSGYLSDLRFSPQGDRIAFLDHPFQWDDRGGVAVVDLKGKKTDLAQGYWGAEGLAWSPDGKEIFFSAGRGFSSFDIRAVTLDGRNRVALAGAGGLTILDIARDGRWLAARDDTKWRLMNKAPGVDSERDLAWLDVSYGAALSGDGRTLLFTEYSGAVGDNYAVCVRKTDGSPVVRLGEGWAGDLSPDGRSVLAVVPTSPDRLMLYPTGPGQPQRLDSGPIRDYTSARWFPDGKTILVCGTDDKQASRCYAQEVPSGKPQPVTPAGTRGGLLSPDGRLVLVQGARKEYQIQPLGGGEPRLVPSLGPEDTVSRWTADGKGFLVYRPSEIPVRLDRVDLASGGRNFVRSFSPGDLTGVVRIEQLIFADDESSYAYSATQRRSDLFLIEPSAAASAKTGR